jgi:hypothetical protein
VIDTYRERKGTRSGRNVFRDFPLFLLSSLPSLFPLFLYCGCTLSHSLSPSLSVSHCQPVLVDSLVSATCVWAAAVAAKRATMATARTAVRMVRGKREEKRRKLKKAKTKTIAQM